MKVADALRTENISELIQKGSHVKGVVYNIKKDFGAFVAIQEPEGDRYIASGLIHSNELFDSVHVGDEIECRVVKVREDGKIDLAMRDEIPQQMEKDAEMVFDIIKSYGGKLPFNDKADAALIKKEFGLSKNAFKRAVGRLYKEKLITINDDSITIN